MSVGGRVVAFVTMSLDGYVAGPNDRVGEGLGDGGERLHRWMFGAPSTSDDGPHGPSAVDEEYLGEVFGAAGAWLVGRTMYDLAEGWGDDPGFGVPVFVVSHRTHDTVVKGDTSFEFVAGGIAAALSRAGAAAAGKDVLIMGGADVLRQYLAAGLVDELMLTIAPVLLGGGKRLFDGIARTDVAFERTGVVESPVATHLRFRVRVGEGETARH